VGAEQGPDRSAFQGPDRPRPRDVVRDPAAREGESGRRQPTRRNVPAAEKTSGMVHLCQLPRAFQREEPGGWEEMDPVPPGGREVPPLSAKHPWGDDAGDGNGEPIEAVLGPSVLPKAPSRGEDPPRRRRPRLLPRRQSGPSCQPRTAGGIEGTAAHVRANY